MQHDRATADLGAVCGLILGLILGSALLNLGSSADSQPAQAPTDDTAQCAVAAWPAATGCGAINHLYATPPMTPPTIGASQNSHS
jgi:hypothetical protein